MKPGVLKDLLDESGCRYREGAKSFVLDCPRCRKSDKLYIRRSDGRFVCWVCKESDNFQGAAEWVLTELLGLSVAVIKERLYGGSGHASLYLDLGLNDWWGDDEIVPTFAPEELLEVSPDPGFRELDTPFGLPGKNYLESRGIDLPLAKKYGLQYWPATKSVVFPVITRGRMIGWQTRYIGPTEYFDEETGVSVKVPKALTFTGFKKDRALMFGDGIVGGHAVLCEGPIDAIKADLCGGNVATLGKAVSKYQLDLLRYSGISKLYLALDPDAFKESQAILKEMSTEMEIYDMRPPFGKEDLGAMSPPEVLQLQRSAPRLSRHHLFLYLEDRYAR